MTRRVRVVEKVLSANDRLAEANRARLDAAGLFAINLLASPGAGKTSLIERTVRALAAEMRLAVIDGDLATQLDADRAAAAGAQAVQINTGGECHLDAVMVRDGLAQLPLEALDLLIVENVGNLVCPTHFQLGTHRSVLVASVPEGDDKPYKYPGSYRGVDALVLNKLDLLPYVPFRVEHFWKGVAALNPQAAKFEVSCQTGAGLTAWLDWLRAGVAEYRTGDRAAEREAA
ncbi:MAG: hydrogenase nickel incorporation protein HypB [Anaerolineales bacterium]|nr:hydrogenase nickel incorporation protein HypB [Anaerolineales bacterium]